MMLENLKNEVKLAAAGGAVFLVLMGGFRAYEEGQKTAQGEAKARIAALVYQNPAKRRATAKITRHGGSLRVVTVVKSPDGTEKTEIREETRPTEVRETEVDESRPIPVPEVASRPSSFIVGGLLDLRARELRPALGYSWRNRVDVAVLPFRVTETREVHAQPSLFVAVRF